MSWPNNHLPKYRKHRASGQAIVTLNGRDYYLGPHGTKASKLEFDRLISEWLSSGRSASFGTGKEELTTVELLAAYLRYAKDYYGKSPKSEYFHLVRVARPLRELYGRTAASDFGPLAFKAVRQRLIDEGLSRTYINACMRRIARIFRWGAGEGLISSTVPQSLSMVAGLRRGRTETPETAPILPVDDTTIEATLPFLSRVVADMVQLQRLSGARPAEICILRPCDVDRTGDVWIYRPYAHKTQHHGRDRIVCFGPKAQAILQIYIFREPETYCFSPSESEAHRLSEIHGARKTPLSCGNKPGSNRVRFPKKRPGRCYTTDSYRRAIHYACDKTFPHPTLGSKVRKEMTSAQVAELRQWQSDHRWSPNQLRHAAATEIRKQFGLEAAQIILGHSAADVTQVYAERDIAKGLDVARKIG